jgi:hypothetical protein
MTSFEARLRNDYAHEGALFEGRAEAEPRIRRALLHRARVRRTRAAVTTAVVVLLTASTVTAAIVTSSRGSNGVSSTSSPTTTTTTAPATTTTTATAATATAPLAHGLQGSDAAVPWGKVGAGWFLAIWGLDAGQVPGQQPPPGQETTTLFLVDPFGGRYSVTSFPSSDTRLDAWSGDSRRALVQDGTVVSEIDLSNGATLSHFRLSPQQSVVAYSRPEGLAILLDGPAGLSRVSTDGSAELSYPETFSEVGANTGTAIYTPDGTELVMGAEKGLALVANDGNVAAQLPVPGVTEGCFAERWWQPGVALASCEVNLLPRLWLVPVSGATPTALTGAPKAPDLGDEDAWQIAAGTYVQDAGACGYQYVAKLAANSTTTPVDIPGTVGSTYILGTFGDEIAVRVTVACGGGVSLMWFNPVTGTTTALLGPPLNGGGVVQALENPNGEG